MNIYVNEDDIRSLDAEATIIKDGDEVSIIPAIAGGHKEPKLHKQEDKNERTQGNRQSGV